MVARLLFLLFLFLPLSFALNPTEGIDLPVVRVYVVLLFLLCLGQGLIKRSVTLFALTLFLPFFGWVLWSASSFLWALDPSWSIRKAVFLINYALLAVVLLTQSTAVLEKTLKMYLWGAIGASIIGITALVGQFFFGIGIMSNVWLKQVLPFFLGAQFGTVVETYPSLLVNILGSTYFRATAFFPDPHIFSYYLGMALPFSFVFWQTKRGSLYKIGSMLLILGIALSFSRGGYGALFGMLIWSMLLNVFSARKIYSAVTLGACLSILACALVSPAGARFLSSFSSDEGSRSARVLLMENALTTLQTKPLLGVGLGNYPLTVKPEALAREPIYAHNLYLDIAVETGLIGQALFLLVLFSALWRTLVSWQSTGSSFSLATHMGLVYFACHGLFETPIFSVHVLPVLILLLIYGIRVKIRE
jgi:O-antigen ligase